MIFATTSGNECASRFRSPINRLASSKVTGRAVLAISAATVRFCRGVTSSMACQLVRVGVRAQRSLSLGGATNATPPRVGLFASVPAGARPSLGRAAQRPCGPAIARSLGALRQLAAGALAGLRHRRSNPGCYPVSSSGLASARGVRVPPRSRDLAVAPRVHRATMPLVQFGLWRGSVIRNGGGPRGRRFLFKRPLPPRSRVDGWLTRHLFPTPASALRERQPGGVQETNPRAFSCRW